MKAIDTLLIIFLSAMFCAAGCGYGTSSLLPAHIKKIHVENFKNSIDIVNEAPNAAIYKTYKPRLEQDITKAVIDKFIFDGNLKIAASDDADAVLKADLIDFKREALRYDEADNVEQYRIVIEVNIELLDTKKNKTLWKFNNFFGSEEFYTSGSQAQSEASAINEAVDDLARRIVEQTIEVW